MENFPKLQDFSLFTGNTNIYRYIDVWMDRWMYIANIEVGMALK